MQKIYVVSSILFLTLSFLLYRHIPSEDAHFDIDSYGYQKLALFFTQHKQMIDPECPLHAPVQPLGYPFFMGLVYSFFGVQIPTLIFIQVLLMLASIMLLIYCTQQLFGAAAATIVGLLAAVNLGFLVYPQFILAESLLLFVLMLAGALLLQYAQTGRTIVAVWAGFLFGCSLLIKPTALLLPIIMAPMIYRSEIESAYKKWQAIVLFMSAFALPPLIYTLRNYYLYGYFSFAPMMALNMYQCFLAKVIHQITGEPIQAVVDNQLRFTAINSFDPAGWQRAQELFVTYLQDHPLTFAYVWMVNVIKTVCGLFTTQLKVLIEPQVQGGDCSFFLTTGTIGDRLYAYIESGITHSWIRWAAWLEAGWMVLRTVLVAIGFWALLQEKKYGLLSIFVLCLILFCGVTGMDGCCRYRIVCEPFLSMITAYALVRIGNKKRVEKL